MTTVININPTGNVSFIHNDDLNPLLQEGPAKLTRASHVEPGDESLGQNPLQWYADMKPSNGPVLGPFPTRTEALAAETEWINTNRFGAKYLSTRHIDPTTGEPYPVSCYRCGEMFDPPGFEPVPWEAECPKCQHRKREDHEPLR